MVTDDLERLQKLQDQHLEKLQQILRNTVKEQKTVLHNATHPKEIPESFGERLSDKVAKFGGSWRFIISFTVILTLWIIYNVLAGIHIFDPYPFILMNLPPNSVDIRCRTPSSGSPSSSYRRRSDASHVSHCPINSRSGLCGYSIRNVWTSRTRSFKSFLSTGHNRFHRSVSN